MSSRTKYTDYDTFKGKNAAKIKNWFSFSHNSIDVIGNSSHPPQGQFFCPYDISHSLRFEIKRFTKFKKLNTTKKIALVTVILLLSVITAFGQSTETAYVDVYWTNNCESCCTPMGIAVCIAIERVSDHQIVAQCCEQVSYGLTNYEISCDFPCNNENEDFKVYTSVKYGCAPSTECCNGKDPGKDATCSELMEGITVDGIVVD